MKNYKEARRYLAIVISLVPVAQKLTASAHADNPPSNQSAVTIPATLSDSRVNIIFAKEASLPTKIRKLLEQPSNGPVLEYTDPRLKELIDGNLRTFINEQAVLRGYDIFELENGFTLLQRAGRNAGIFRIAEGTTILVDPNEATRVDLPTHLAWDQARVEGHLEQTTSLVAVRGQGAVFGLPLVVERSTGTTNIQAGRTRVGGSFPHRLLDGQPQSMSMAEIIAVEGHMLDGLRAEMSFHLRSLSGNNGNRR